MCRMIADPAFLYKLLLEQAANVGFAVSWELKNRKDRFLFACYINELPIVSSRRI